MKRPVINILPMDLANKIAAGEVVERPMSVVKELVENSIDAGATHIRVEARDGGKEYIRVIDNGGGMSEEDLKLAFSRHATSKIATLADLDNITTLGFRGEALPAIASCSEVEVLSRPAESDVAFRVVVKNGQVASPAAAAGPPGTSVTVRRLFYNTPARYKFLRQPATERRYIVEYLTHMALAHPAISFGLTMDDVAVLSTPGKADLLTAIHAVYGPEIAGRMIPLAGESPFLRIGGFIAPPQENRHNRSHMSVFVNGRWVQNHQLYAAIEKGYETLLPGRRYPVAVLHLTIEPAMLDVNVHPAKTEIRFRYEQETFKHIMLTVKQTLSGTDLVPKIQSAKPSAPFVVGRVSQPPPPPYRAERGELFGKTPASSSLSPPSPISPSPSPPPPSASPLSPLLTTPRPPELRVSSPMPMAKAIPAKALEETAATAATLPTDEESGVAGEMLRQATLLGQVLDTYLVIAAPFGLWLIDQHAAHERILYEKLLAGQKTEGKPPVQMLLTPLDISLSPAEAAVVDEMLPALNEIGLQMEVVDHREHLYRVWSVPLALSRLEDKEVLRELLADLTVLPEEGRGLSLLERSALTLACHGAIKAGESLSLPVQQSLVASLAAAANPFTCPHGRPVMIAIDRSELERRFGRR
ncbi:MAG TPA: DNA mismatch repair endonuclease MutL [Firmicutes bacterium]|nr:DNA mismatch repair endonuclease MutL [Bacillota bacterium]